MATSFTPLPRGATLFEIETELEHRRHRGLSMDTANTVETLLHVAADYGDDDDELARKDALLNAAMVLLDGKNAAIAGTASA